jgi:hypothetical protein
MKTMGLKSKGFVTTQKVRGGVNPSLRGVFRKDNRLTQYQGILIKWRSW